MKPPLQIKDLVIDYTVNGKIHRAVDSLNLNLAEGEIFGLLGPNGAGKTSIISAVTGLWSEFDGEIKLFGAASGSMEAKRCVGLVPQETVSYGFFSVEEILKFNAGYFGVAHPAARIEFLLKRLQLWDVRHKKMAQLSGGMKRRLMIAKALIHSPRLLLLDEPSAGVDVELRELLWEFVRELNREGVTIVLTTHYIEEAERLCHRIGVIHLGKLLALDETRRLTRSIAQRCLQIQLHNGNRLEKTIPADCDLSQVFQELSLRIEDIKDLKIEEPRLEDAFKQIVFGKGGVS